MVQRYFATPMNEIMEPQSIWTPMWQRESFIDLDCADDISLLKQTTEVLLLALEVMEKESKAFVIEINWDKSKIQTTADCPAGQVLSTTAERKRLRPGVEQTTRHIAAP